MDENKSNILLKIKEIENTIANTKITNCNKHLFHILNVSIDNILKNDIYFIKKSNEDKIYFDDLPIEILENIFNNIDMELLFKMKCLNKKLKSIIDGYINRNICYYFEFRIGKYNISKNFYMKITCKKCKSDFIDAFNCRKCKFKKCEYKYKNIKNIEIHIFREVNHYLGLMIRYSYKYINIIKEIYNNSNIYNLRLKVDTFNYTIYENREKFENIFTNIIKLVLTKTINKVELVSHNEINKETYIENKKLKYLAVHPCFHNLRLKIENISEINIYKTNKAYDEILHFINYINCFSFNIKYIEISHKLLKELSHLEKINSNLKKLYIIVDVDTSEKILAKDLYDLSSKHKSIKNIELSRTNERFIKPINKIDYIENIFVNKEFKSKKYIKKYKKIKIIDNSLIHRDGYI